MNKMYLFIYLILKTTPNKLTQMLILERLIGARKKEKKKKEGKKK